jgi:hypothetical protein
MHYQKRFPMIASNAAFHPIPAANGYDITGPCIGGRWSWHRVKVLSTTPDLLAHPPRHLIAKVEAGGRALVIKRYNLKNPFHALSRCWRPSRAWQAWLNGHQLAFFGIATPSPLALIEERLGPLRLRAFLITDFCPGENLQWYLLPDREPEPAEAAEITALFDLLFRLRITHGDTKAANFLWHAGRLVLIDLDSMIRHDGEAAFMRAWRHDRARFLRNWPPQSTLWQWLDAHLPEAR